MSIYQKLNYNLILFRAEGESESAKMISEAS
jgi:hypothetical protein